MKADQRREAKLSKTGRILCIEREIVNVVTCPLLYAIFILLHAPCVIQCFAYLVYVKDYK